MTRTYKFPARARRTVSRIAWTLTYGVCVPAFVMTGLYGLYLMKFLN